MRIIYYPDTLPQEGSYAATIGFFDGVHRGHRHVIESLRLLAAERHLQTMAVTFDRHPRQVVQPQWQPLLLTTLPDKLALLAETGIDVAVVLRFDAAMAALSAREFMQHVLKERLRVGLLLTGYDNRFGHNRSEGFADYVGFGRQMGIDVVGATPCEEDGCRFSSSLIRQHIAHGRIEQANVCLGRCYSLGGTVGHGEQIGRTIGFPTANIVAEDPCLLVPPFGVYAVRVSLPDLDTPASALNGIMNIGMRPTFNGHEPTMEVHVLGFEGNLYGRKITVEFVARLRDERAFDTPEALALQMGKDTEQALKVLNQQ